MHVLGRVIQIKFVNYQTNLWFEALQGFLMVMGEGTSILSQSQLSTVEMNVILTDITDSIESFLLYQPTNGVQGKGEEIERDEDLDTALCNTIVQLLGQPTTVPILQERLINLLFECTVVKNEGREKIVKTSWTLLFNLASLRQQPKLPQSPRKPSKSQSKTQSQQSNSQSQTQKQQPQQSKGNLKDKYPPLQTANEIAKIVGPRLIAKCKTLLQTFVLDERSGTTLDRSRVSEIVFILKQLDTLNVSPVISLKRSGPKAHLLELFPVLCDCITTNETKIKQYLQKIFFRIANELNLIDVK